ncbi:hypothetical protein [Microbacterium gilvum]|uniref:Uncharacterized protein n=1 Tax=Microbacterium gilvum TaxID=1336204 RepID=A0ABP8ZQY8_9MICO
MTAVDGVRVDPVAMWQAWRHEFEWHLDQVPLLLETMREHVVLVRSTRYDQVKITGGGYVDNMPSAVGSPADRDSNLLWAMLVVFTKSATEWINAEVLPPAAPIYPVLAQDRRTWLEDRVVVDPDGRTAGARADVTTKWLIAHAERIYPIEALDTYREGLFRTIRRYRAIYSAAGTVRRDRPITCRVCGQAGVLSDWITGADGRGTQIGRCKHCGEQYLPGE